MSLLRLHCSLQEPPPRCRWALVNAGREAVTGEGSIDELPRHAAQVQVVLPATQVLLARARLPASARAGAGSTLAFAVEEQTAVEPDANQVRWLGQEDGEDILAVFDKAAFARWRAALDAAGVHEYQVVCETLLLPWTAGGWSLAWDGAEGHVRTGPFSGTATDSGTHDRPPLSLTLLLERARASGTAPEWILLQPTTTDATPDLAAWSRQLDTQLRLAQAGDWRTAAADAGVSLGNERRRWPGLPGFAKRLRPVAWTLAAALAIHAVALALDWMALASEEQALRTQMETRFRQTFPDAVAVADPALQMRRRLADARHAAGQVDAGDFLALIGPFAEATQALPAGSLRSLSHEGGRLTAELVGIDSAGVARVASRLRQSGLVARDMPATAAGGPVILIVEAP